MSPLIALASALLLTAVPPQPPAKLAAPGFQAVQVPEDVVRFYSEHFAQQLVLEGFQVITGQQISTLVGLERQKQLMGCSDESCMAELAGALGVDAMITGSIGKFGSAYQVNVTILAAGTGQVLAAHSQKLRGEEEVLDALTQAARKMAPTLRQRLGRAPAEPVTTNIAPVPQALTSVPPAAPPAAPAHWKSFWWAPVAAGVVSTGVGGYFLYRTSVEYQAVAQWREATGELSLEEMATRVRLGSRDQVLGLLFTGLGLAAAGGGVWMLATQPQAPRLSVGVDPSGGGVVLLQGVLP